MPPFTLHQGHILDVLRGMPDASIEACVTDPPYEFGFMGKSWDASGISYSVEMWREVLRVLKPGAHLLTFGGTRTYHRMACAIEDAGFEIRDQMQWIYGQGFPKSRNIGGGWGTALKPAHEPLCLARKPLSEPNVAANVLKHGTGALNIDGCRINPTGRWPANVMLDEEAGRLLDEQTGELVSGKPSGVRNSDGFRGRHRGNKTAVSGFGDSGGASRFFYCAKASRAERDAGVEGMPEVARQAQGRDVVRVIDRKDGRGPVPVNAQIRPAANHHPTVKPVELMRYLCRLVTPPGGTVLDPLMGSGSTGVAALLEGFEFVGIELGAEFVEIARRRISGAAPLFNEECEAKIF